MLGWRFTIRRRLVSQPLSVPRVHSSGGMSSPSLIVLTVLTPVTSRQTTTTISASADKMTIEDAVRHARRFGEVMVCVLYLRALALGRSALGVARLTSDASSPFLASHDSKNRGAR